MQAALFSIGCGYSRSLRFQLIRSPNVVDEDEDDEDWEDGEPEVAGPEPEEGFL